VKPFDYKKEQRLEFLGVEELAVDLLFSELMETVLDGVKNLVETLLLAALRQAIEELQY
jgi:hypothetical protein